MFVRWIERIQCLENIGILDTTAHHATTGGISINVGPRQHQEFRRPFLQHEGGKVIIARWIVTAIQLVHDSFPHV